MRKVLFLTGIRSEYDILAPVIQAAREAGMDAGVIVTGAHLAAAHGNSARQIEADGFRIARRIASLPDDDSLAARVTGAGVQLAGLADALAAERPDFLTVLGDREESITGALAGAWLGVPVAHIHGGDQADTGNVNNLIRHAVTKLASLHFAASPKSGERIRALGEEPWRIHVVGAPGLDRLARTPTLARAELLQKLGIAWPGEFAVVIYHPTIRDFGAARGNIELILASLARTGLALALVHPNSDPGNRAIAAAMVEFAAAHPARAKSFPYLPRLEFVNLLRQARLLVGNSSAGIIEAPFLKLPTVNVGVRQVGREHGDNVIFCDYREDALAAALGEAMSDAFRRRTEAGANPYGDGHAGERIAAVLASVELGARLAAKPFIDRPQP